MSRAGLWVPGPVLTKDAPAGALAQSFDQRAIDSAYAAAFLSEVKRIIETRVWTQDVQSELEKKHGGHEATQARLDRHRPHGIHDGRVAGS
jgi:hypothetical protein